VLENMQNNRIGLGDVHTYGRKKNISYFNIIASSLILRNSVNTVVATLYMYS